MGVAVDLRGKLFRLIATLVALLIFALALWTLYLELGRYPTEQIVGAVADTALRQVLLALGLLLLSYLMTAVSEHLAARYGGLRLSSTRAATAALVAVGISNSVSFGLLTGGALRHRLYGSWGVSAIGTTKILAFSRASHWLGYAAVAGTGLLLVPPESLPLRELGGFALPLLGAVLLLTGPLYVLAAHLLRGGVRLKNLKLQPPGLRLSVAQLLSAALDWFAGSAIVFVLLPPSTGGSYGIYMAAFAVAVLAGALSQLPGGLGVFDSALIFLLSPIYSVPAVTGALILYRLIYFLLPLSLGLLILLAREIYHEQSALRSLTYRFGKRVASILPSAMTLAVFLSGVLLLFSGATPAESIRMRLLQSVIPLPMVEISHLLASVIGVALLFLARGLQRRLDIAHAASVVLIGSSILVSLTKGADWEEATVLLAVLSALIALRKHFYRRSRLMDTPFSARWIVAVILVLMTTAWLTVFANRPVSLNRYLWLQVTPEGDAARSLRALGGVLGVAAILFILRGVTSWLEKPRGKPGAGSPIIQRIVRESSTTYAFLALMNDKEFFLNDEQDAFIMYTVSGKSWIAMGDPIGPRERWPELIWQFKEESDRRGFRALFYETGSESVPVYSELGLAALSLGQEARIELESFSIHGRENHDLRNARNRMRREGWELAIIEPGELEPLFPKLREVSDAWLASKGKSERGFALGWFDPEYLRQFPMALVRRGDEVIAFANIWQTRDREEASVDLMRHLPEAPSQTMDFLFLELIERFQEDGFRWFNLGLAPLSGMEQQELSPLWHRLAGILYRHGDHFYSFQGLRSYKEKFHPRWEPKYLIAPSGISLPAALFDLTRLASRVGEGRKRKIVDRRERRS